MLPCIESYQKVDLRTITLGVPPQEVGSSDVTFNTFLQGYLTALEETSLQFTNNCMPCDAIDEKCTTFKVQGQ